MRSALDPRTLGPTRALSLQMVLLDCILGSTGVMENLVGSAIGASGHETGSNHLPVLQRSAGWALLPVTVPSGRLLVPSSTLTQLESLNGTPFGTS